MQSLKTEKLDIDLLNEIIDSKKVILSKLAMDEFLLLPISVIKTLNTDEIIRLNTKMKIFIVNDLKKLNFRQIIQVKDIFDDKDLVNKIYDIKRKIHEIIEIRSKRKTKIIFLGIDNAGKSTIINIFKKAIKQDDLTKIQPTIGVKREQMFLKNFIVNILDLGGQKKYRHHYFKSPERFFEGLSLVFYVIDIQDDHRYEETLYYLKAITEIISQFNNNEDCEFIILIHKFDPELMNDIIYQEKFEYLSEEIEKIMLNNYEFKIIKSSIYNSVYFQDNDFMTQFNSLFTLEESLNNQIQYAFKQINELREDIAQIYKSIESKSEIKPILRKPKQRSEPSAVEVNPRVQLRSEMIKELKAIIKMRLGTQDL
ncbi:MAG: ADP-ribosylation factor-like protein [Candidatus Helarchaeota archaeon]